ncbi:MAG: hypothetical protein WC457_01030 [Patescibacteria group bacterium]
MTLKQISDKEARQKAETDKSVPTTPGDNDGVFTSVPKKPAAGKPDNDHMRDTVVLDPGKKE